MLTKYTQMIPTSGVLATNYNAKFALLDEKLSKVSPNSAPISAEIENTHRDAMLTYRIFCYSGGSD